MKPDLNDFYREERKQVFEPGPYFIQRVMAGVASGRISAAGLWDVMPGAVRSALAVSFVVLFLVLVVQILVPVQPSRAALEPYNGQVPYSGEQLLFADPQLSTGAAQFEELMVLEPVQ